MVRKNRIYGNNDEENDLDYVKENSVGNPVHHISKKKMVQTLNVSNPMNLNMNNWSLYFGDTQKVIDRIIRKVLK